MKQICSEAPVSLFVNGEKFLTFMCSPKNLEELAIGYLFSSGILSSLDEIIGVGVSDNISSKKISVVINKVLEKSDENFQNLLFSSCGSGGATLNKNLLKHEKDFRIKSNLIISKKTLAEKYSNMLKLSAVTKSSAGMHESFLTDLLEEGENILCEDIGRHNAVDKVIGFWLKKKLNFENSLMIVTGRISSDMISKAVQIKIPVVASVSVPSDLAIEIAEQFGICIVGRLGRSEPIIYTCESRIK